VAEGAGPEQFPDLMEDIQSTLHTVARLQRERAALVGRAAVRRGRVSVAVNADNVLVDLKFGRDVEDLDYPELARAVIEATQAATADVARKSRELMQPLQAQRARLPKLSTLVPGMPNLRDQLPVPEPPPSSKPRGDRIDGADGEFDDAEMVDRRGPREPGVTDSGW
jgi:DNA-binding protein YbaB